MTRVEMLNQHLNNLTAVNEHGDYNDDIRNTVTEINKELGVGGAVNLSSYATEELRRELTARDNIREIKVSLGSEAVVSVVVGDEEQVTAVQGPARILINDY